MGTAAGPQTRLLRRRFLPPVPAKTASILLFAESQYHLWFNGHYLGRGPVFRHPFRGWFDHYDLTPWLTEGEQIVACLVYTPGFGLHNHVPSGRPGLACRIELHTHDGTPCQTLDTDEHWRITDRTGWRWESPRRSWALGSIEVFDAAEAPTGWQGRDFADHDWATPDLHPLGEDLAGWTVAARPLPDLRYQFVAAGRIMRLESVSQPVTPLTADAACSALGKELLAAGLAEPDDRLRVVGQPGERGGGWRVEGLTSQLGAAVHLDLGRQYVGQPLFTLSSNSAGVVDFAYSETQEQGRTQWLRKGVSYVDRIFAPAGQTRWEPIGFTGARYLSLILRGFTGTVSVEQVGMRASEPALAWVGEFDCDRPDLVEVWKLCERTIRVGTQEGLMDCPTREQAPYVGDGHPVAEWIALLTGDLRHWRYLTVEQFARQATSGLIRSTPFSWRDDTLIDYNLIAIIGTRDYLRASGDLDAVRPLLEPARRLLQWFASHADGAGLFALSWPEMRGGGEMEDVYDPARPRITSKNLFIDHPGMGWHNVGEAGIDRRGLNAAINMLHICALRAMAEIEEATGTRDRADGYRGQAAALAATARQRFFDPGRGCFIDGVLDGTPLPQVSEQTNIWAIRAGCTSPPEARRIITDLRTCHDPAIARGGPYFWCYLLPLMAELGLHRQALDDIAKLWKHMPRQGATTVWETFVGDDLDSWCHPWSCAPLPFLLLHILGLPRTGPTTEVVLRPRYDLLTQASGCIASTHGPVRIAWHTDGNRIALRGELPANMTATVLSPDDRPLGNVRHRWKLTASAVLPAGRQGVRP